MTDTLNLSPFSIAEYIRCGMRYQHRYVLHTPITVGPSPAAVRGRAMHKGAETDLRERIKDPETVPPLEVSVTAAVEAFEQSERGEDVYEREDGTVIVTQGEPPAWEQFGEKAGKNKDLLAAQMVPTWHSQIAPTTKPKAVEQWAAITLNGDGVSVRLRGRLDVLPADGVLSDLKHSRKAFGKTNYSTTEDAGTDDQLTAYDLLYRAATEQIPSRLGFDTVMLDGKRGSDDLFVTGIAQPRVEPRTEAQLQRYLDKVQRVAKGIQAGVFVPTTPDSWSCSSRWCPFWRKCAYGGAK